jgi:hypothetical protein
MGHEYTNRARRRKRNRLGFDNLVKYADTDLIFRGKVVKYCPLG